MSSLDDPQLSARAKAFLEELEALCAHYHLHLAVSGYDSLQLWEALTGEAWLICNGIEDKLASPRQSVPITASQRQALAAMRQALYTQMQPGDTMDSFREWIAEIDCFVEGQRTLDVWTADTLLAATQAALTQREQRHAATGRPLTLEELGA